MSKFQEKLPMIEKQPIASEDTSVHNETIQAEIAETDQPTDTKAIQNNALESFPFILKLHNAWTSFKKALEAPITKPNLNQEWVQQIKSKINKLFGGSA